MDKDSFIQRLADAVKAEVPELTQRGPWLSRKADDIGMPEERLKAYCYGENECPGSTLLKLFEHFGPDFEAAVRGLPDTPDDDPLKLCEQLREALKRQDRVVPLKKEGRVG